MGPLQGAASRRPASWPCNLGRLWVFLEPRGGGPQAPCRVGPGLRGGIRRQLTPLPTHNGPQSLQSLWPLRAGSGPGAGATRSRADLERRTVGNHPEGGGMPGSPVAQMRPGGPRGGQEVDAAPRNLGITHPPIQAPDGPVDSSFLSCLQDVLHPHCHCLSMCRLSSLRKQPPEALTASISPAASPVCTQRQSDLF